MLMNLLEPHHFGSVGLAVLGIIALYCAISDAGGNLFWCCFIVMTSLAGLAVAQSQITIELALLSHIIVFHTVLLSAYSHIKFL